MRRASRSIAIVLAASILSLALTAAGSDARASEQIRSTLKPGRVLGPGERLRSPSRDYVLIMRRKHGDLVLYRDGEAIWSTGPVGRSARAVMRKGGNLVLVRRSKVKWASGTAGFHRARLVLQDDGNLVIYQRGHAIWTYGLGYIGHTLLPGATLKPDAFLKSPNRDNRFVMQGTDGNLVLYGPSAALWDFGTVGHPGARAVMQGDGNFVVYEGDQALNSTQTDGYAGSYLQVQDDANVVVYKDPATPVWSRTGGLVLPKGPNAFPNAAIADHAELRADGADEDECLAFVSNMIVEAGGPRHYFGTEDTDSYQSQWAEIATQIGSIADARRGDIIQWGGGAGGTLLHTSIVTMPGPDPSLIDSNWEGDHLVHRGPFSSRNLQDSVYRIWRVGQP